MGPAAIPALTDVLKVKHEQSRFVAEALGNMGPEANAAVPQLQELLDDKDGLVRQAAAEALGKIGVVAQTAIPQLTKLLHDEDLHIRVAAADALGKMGPEAKTAVAPLTELLNVKYHRVRAADAPAKTDPEAKANVSNDSVRAAAAIALGNIGPEAKAALLPSPNCSTIPTKSA